MVFVLLAVHYERLSNLIMASPPVFIGVMLLIGIVMIQAIVLVEYIERGRRRGVEMQDLVTAMVLTLFLIPCLYVVVQRIVERLSRLLLRRPARTRDRDMAYDR